MRSSGYGAAISVLRGCDLPAIAQHLAGDPTEHFAVMVPEASLHEGRNEVEVFEVTRSGSLRALARS